MLDSLFKVTFLYLHKLLPMYHFIFVQIASYSYNIKNGVPHYYTFSQLILFKAISFYLLTDCQYNKKYILIASCSYNIIKWHPSLLHIFILCLRPYLSIYSQIIQLKIKSLLLSHHHSTSALVSEILESVLQTVQKQFTYGQYIFTDCTEDNVQNTHTYTQYTQCTIRHT